MEEECNKDDEQVGVQPSNGSGSSYQMRSYSRTIFKKCDSLGEAAVREQSPHWFPRKRKVAEEWLLLQDQNLSSERLSRAEMREEENLSISRKALANSERATRIAISAIILSIIVAISKIIEYT